VHQTFEPSLSSLRSVYSPSRSLPQLQPCVYDDLLVAHTALPVKYTLLS
jgi:hypothetical protein